MNPPRLHPILLAVLLSTAWAPTALAQSPKPMGLVDLLNIPRVGDPQLSPDGRDILFTRSESDWKIGRRLTHIWRVRTSGGDPVQLTNGAESENSPRWSPDGRTIAFVAKRGDAEFNQIYLLPVDGGEASPLTSHPSAVSSISWTSDGAALYFTASEPQSARGEGPGQGARRRVRVRGELQADAPVESRRREQG